MNERDSRIAQIQGLYDKLEPLWLRLEVEQDQQDLFIEMNRGCGETVIRAVRCHTAHPPPQTDLCT